ncbi:MAG: 4Fe-4S dicluster domain-containing protein [Candidatus Bathyarchaeota archaeon]|jgi:heterodisulfide reductase subunit C|nr:4Fe-4S dicluster domain-containing protein [Candidatus Bathyarchaeota archaeon]
MAHGKTAKSSGKTFLEEVRHMLGGETLASCYQCGTCASSCPVARVSERFNPREVIRQSLLGEKEEILFGDALWLCCSCYNCQERCPQKVEIADVFYALRNLAIREGKMPNIYSEFSAGLMSEGKIVPMSKFLEKKRADYGLPPLKPANMDTLRKILSATGFDKLKKKEEPQ